MKHFFALSLVLACLVSSDHTLGGVPNSRWSCSGCRDDQHRIDIFGAIHQAIHREERGAYLAVDMSWLDQILLPSASVHVTVVARDALANFVHPSTLLDERNLTAPPLPDQLVYNMVVSEVPESVRTDHRVRSRRAYFEPPPPSSLIFTGVDPFLTLNPCFMPLAEPVRSMHGKMGNVGAAGTRRRLLALGGVEVEESGQVEREQRGLGGRLLVLVGMPHNVLHSTCQLYKAITRFQFPQKCSYTNTSMAVHELSNIGYAHTVIHFTHAFVNNLFSEGRVSIAPRPDPYYARKFIYMHPTTNQQISGFGWGWADPETCPEQTYLHEPFACNFLSLSNCSDRHRSAHLKAEDLTAWTTPSSKLQSTGPPEEPWGLGITAASREAFGDSPVFSEEEWVQSRTMAFVQRPNAYLRLLIRNSLRNIVILGGAGGSPAEGGTSPTASQTQALAHHATLHAQILSPCLAMHVRHQDLYLEEHRVRLGIDRSLLAHVQHARNLTRALGLRKIYLATDNASVFEEVAGRYPEYTWLMQRRPVPQKLVMFGMFTKMYETDAIFNQTAEQRDGHSKIPGLPDSAQSRAAPLHESVTATLSHILADWRAAAQCSAVVGAFDSGFTAQMYRTMCAMGRHRGVRGKCPPSFDLRNTERKPASP